MNSGSPDFKSKFSKEKTAEPKNRFSLVSHKVTRVLVTSLDLSPFFVCSAEFIINLTIIIRESNGIDTKSNSTWNTPSITSNAS